MRKIIYYLFLIFIICIFLISGYPRSDYPTGQPDSYFNIMLSKSIGENHNIIWLKSPWSIIGRYPFSYPPGNAIILSITQIIPNITNTSTWIYIYSSFMAIIGILGFTLLLNNYFHKSEVTIIGISIFSLSPIYIWFTQYNSTARILIFSLTPFILLLLHKFEYKNEYRWIILFSLLSTTLIISHSVGFLILIISLLIIFLIILRKKYYKNTIKMNFKKYKSIIVLILLLYFITIFSTLVLTSGGQSAFNKFTSGYLGNYSNNPFLNLLNIFITYFSKIFLVAIFGIISLLFMIFIQNNKFGLMIFTWGFFISILLIYPEYNSSFILPWLCIISGILIFKIFQKKDKRIFFILFIIIFIANPVYSNYRINSWNDQQRNIRGLDYGSIDQYVFDAIIGIRYLDENSTFLSNDGQFYLGKYYIYHYIQIEGDAFYLKKIDFLNMTIIIKNPIEFITDFPNTYEIHPPVWSIDNSVQEKLPNNYYIVNKNIIDFKYFEGVLSTDVNFDIIQRDSYSYYQNNIIIIFYIK